MRLGTFSRILLLLAGWFLLMPSRLAASSVLVDDFNDNAINPSL
jgi:hypothetical protein